MTVADHEAAVKLLKTMAPGAEIVLVLYREKTVYNQPPPVNSDVIIEQVKSNGHVMNANSNNAAGIDEPHPVLDGDWTQTDGEVKVTEEPVIDDVIEEDVTIETSHPEEDATEEVAETEDAVEEEQDADQPFIEVIKNTLSSIV